MTAKPFWESKTVWWNLLTVAAAILALPEVTKVIPVDWMPYILAVNGIVNVGLRFITTEPVKAGL